jgi:hypothetical protein
MLSVLLMTRTWFLLAGTGPENSGGLMNCIVARAPGTDPRAARAAGTARNRRISATP